MNTNRYLCTGIQRDSYVSKEVSAVSEKQALYFFKKMYGWNMYNAKATIIKGEDQIKWDI